MKTKKQELIYEQEQEEIAEKVESGTGVIELQLIGRSPLLMHNPQSMLEKKETVSTLDKFDTVKEAKASAYITEKGELYVPSSAIFGSMLSGASFKKSGKFSAKSILAGNVKIEVDQIILRDLKGNPLKKYETDIRTVCLGTGKQKKRIIRSRPRIDEWRLDFKILFNKKFIQGGKEEIILQCLEDAGFRIGLLDFRPACSGSYGTFEVTKFKVVE